VEFEIEVESEIDSCMSLQKTQQEVNFDDLVTLKMDTIIATAEDDKRATVENSDFQHQSIKEQRKKCDVGSELEQNLEYHLGEQIKENTKAENLQ